MTVPYITENFSTVRPSVRTLTRACVATGIAAMERTTKPERIVAREWPREEGVDWLVRAATTPTGLGDAPGVVRTIMPDFMATLAAESAAAQVFKEGLRLSFDRAGQINVPTILGDSTWGAFVAEGAPIPIAQSAVAPLVSLTPHKLNVVVVLTTEMLRSSNAETLIFDALVRSAGLTLDAALFDASPASAARPAGLRYNIAAITASAAPDPTAALLADVEALHAEVSAVNTPNPTYVASHTRALMAELISPHSLDPLKVLGTQPLKGSKILMVISPRVVASVSSDGFPEILVMREAALHMETAPAQDVGGASPLRSMFQTDCVALLVRIPVTWVVRSPIGISWLVCTNW
jgi:hypothetical protein